MLMSDEFCDLNCVLIHIDLKNKTMVVGMVYFPG